MHWVLIALLAYIALASNGADQETQDVELSERLSAVESNLFKSLSSDMQLEVFYR